MSVHVECPACGRGSAISAEFAGRELVCPNCEQRFAAPAPSGRWVYNLLRGAYLMTGGCGVVVGAFVVIAVIVVILAAPEPQKFQQPTPSIRPPAPPANGYPPAAR